LNLNSSYSATRQAVQEIDRLTQSIETDLLQGFSDAQEQELNGVANAQDFKTMQEHVLSLLAYNGKDKIIDRYVWNIMKEKLAKYVQQMSMIRQS
jgi:hypothetical protein